MPLGKLFPVYCKNGFWVFDALEFGLLRCDTLYGYFAVGKDVTPFAFAFKVEACPCLIRGHKQQPRLVFRFEFLSVDFVFAIEPVAVLVGVTVVAVFDGCVVDS